MNRKTEEYCDNWMKQMVEKISACLVERRNKLRMLDKHKTNQRDERKIDGWMIR